MQQIRATFSASISELKKNPSALLVKADGEAIAILNHNSPTAYLVPALEYEMLLDKLEDFELGQLVMQRQGEKPQAITVSIDSL
jgi:antitoxin StbD